MSKSVFFEVSALPDAGFIAITKIKKIGNIFRGRKYCFVEIEMIDGFSLSE